MDKSYSEYKDHLFAGARFGGDRYTGKKLYITWDLGVGYHSFYKKISTDMNFLLGYRFWFLINSYYENVYLSNEKTNNNLWLASAKPNISSFKHGQAFEIPKRPVLCHHWQPVCFKHYSLQKLAIQRSY